LALARRRCSDDKAGVRRAAVQLLEALLLLRASGAGGTEAVAPSEADLPDILPTLPYMLHLSQNGTASARKRRVPCAVSLTIPNSTRKRKNICTSLSTLVCC
jgi:hypothetical protein